MKTKHQRIVESNRRSAAARRDQPKGDVVLGAFLVFMGFAVGPAIAGLITGLPLIAIGLDGMRKGGYPEPHGQRYQRRWLQSVNDDFERIEHGEDPAGDRLKQRLRKLHNAPTPKETA